MAARRARYNAAEVIQQIFQADDSEQSDSEESEDGDNYVSNNNELWSSESG